MGNTPLLQILENAAHDRFFCSDRKLSSTQIDTHSDQYLVLSRPNAPDLWMGLIQACKADKILVVLPTTNPTEGKAYLKQLCLRPPTHARVVFFSSGSEGVPKAVYHGEDNLLAQAQQLATVLKTFDQLLVGFTPWGMAGFAFHLLAPLFSSLKTVTDASDPLAIPYAPSFAPRRLYVCSPDWLRIFLRRQDRSPEPSSFFTFTASLNEPLRREFLHKCVGSQICEGYGMTEAAGPITLRGQSLGCELTLSKENELLLSGPQLMLGSSSDGLWTPLPRPYATGDLFNYQDKKWNFISRRRDLIEVADRKVPPQLIEDIVLTLEEIKSCVAFTKVISGVSRVAFIYELESGYSAQMVEEKISRLVRESFSLESRPAWWREFKIPRLPSGKPDKQKISSEVF